MDVQLQDLMPALALKNTQRRKETHNHSTYNDGMHNNKADVTFGEAELEQAREIVHELE